MLIALAGRIGGDEPAWPPAWPPSRTKSSDEKQAALLADFLGLDKSGWHQLCAEAWRLASSRRFGRLEQAFSTALEHTSHLDGRAVAALIGASMEHTTKSADITATDRGEFSAVVAAYTIDRDREQIVEGAFRESLASWQASGTMIPLHWGHRGDPAAIIGSVDPASKVEVPGKGLIADGRLDLDDSELAREAWRSMKANRVAFSFGFLATKTRKRGDGVPSHTALERRLIEEGIIAPIVDPAIFEQERDLMLNLLGARRNGDEREGKALTEAELKAQAKALGIDIGSKSTDSEPIQVASFEV